MFVDVYELELCDEGCGWLEIVVVVVGKVDVLVVWCV